ncbi:MAG: hypothetical protein K2H56_00460 [Malacoplasma sp.]|nr:hypothetical protein [Malacoplasma sp.]
MNQVEKNVAFKHNKSLFINSIICFITGIFLVPFGYFGVSLFPQYLNQENVNSFILIIVLLVFDLFFYIYFEILQLIKITKNKQYFSKKIYMLVYLSFVFTFITNFVLIVLFLKDIFKDFKVNKKP